MANYEDEKKRIKKWLKMIDEYLLEPNSIDAEWVDCLYFCRELMNHKLLQQANSLYRVFSLQLQNYYLQMKDVWMVEDYRKSDEYSTELLKAIAEYETLYGKVPEYENIEELIKASNKLRDEIQEVYYDRKNNKA